MYKNTMYAKQMPIFDTHFASFMFLFLFIYYFFVVVVVLFFIYLHFSACLCLFACYVKRTRKHKTKIVKT